MTFNSLKFDSSENEIPRLMFCNCPSFIQPLDYMSVVNIRSVETSFSTRRSIKHDDFATALSKARLSELCFSSVHSITASINLIIDDKQANTIDKKSIAHNALTYLRLIERMFPAVNDFNLKRFYIHSLFEEALRLPVISRLLDIMSRVTSVGFERLGGVGFLDDSIAARFNDLTSFTFKRVFATLRFADVIRRNSKTLINIKLAGIPIYPPEHFLYQEDGSVVVYPCLKSLVFFDYALPCSQPLSYPASSSVHPVHFPNLKIFVTEKAFPFNFNFIPILPMTIERLCICLPNTPADLSKFLPFPFISFPNLKYLDIRNHKNGTRCEKNQLEQRDALFIEIVKTIFSSSGILNNFELAYPISKAAFFEHILVTDTLAYICKLHIPNIELNFSDFVVLLKSAQRLQILECNLDSSDLTFEGIDSEQLPQYVLENISPLSKNFQKLVIGYNTHFIQQDLAEIISLIAFMCPNFTQLDFKYRDPRSTLMIMREIYKSDMFENFSYILRPFILRLASQDKNRDYWI